MIQKNELDKILNGDGLKNLWKRCFQLIKYVTGDVDESKGSIQEQIDGKLDASDIKDVKVDFTSNDTENVTQMPTLPQIKSGSKLSDQLSAISDFCKGVRYLGRLIGSADISEIGDGTDIGTITGAISKLNSDMVHTPKFVKLQISEKVSFSNISDWTIVFDYTAQNECILVADGILFIETNIPYDGGNGMDAFICDMWTCAKVDLKNNIVLPIHWSGYMNRGARFIVALGLNSQYTYTINSTSTDDTRRFSCNITEFPF